MHLSSLSDIKNFRAECRQTAQEMDNERQRNTAYEYLCHLEEAKLWMETVLNERLPPSVELEESLRNGVFLAKIGNFIAPNVVPLSRIYDIFQHRYRNLGLQFRHTDNINYFIESLKSVGVPKMFFFETTDLYDKKNMPKVIYCIHALSAHLFRLGQAPVIEDLYGKVQFTEQEIETVSFEIKKNSITLPLFQKIGGLLSEELTRDVASLHSGIININKAIDEESEEDLLKALNDNSVALAQVIPEYIAHYLKTFKNIKREKLEAVQNRSLNKSETDTSDELLNQSEIQGHIRRVNIDCIWQDILKSIRKKKKENVREIIAASFVSIKNFAPQNISYYVDEALSLDLNQATSYKSVDTIQMIVRNGNRNAKEHCRVSDAVAKVKSAILSGSKEKLLTALRSPALKLASHVTDFAAPLYLEEMEADLKTSKSISYKDLKSSVFVLNDIAKITSAVDSRDLNATWMQITSSDIPFMNIDPALKSQYFNLLFACRQEKLTKGAENHLLTFVDIQECIDIANIKDLQQTRAVIHLEEINEAVQTNNTESLKLAMEGLIPGEISPQDADLCLQLLKKCLARKQQNSDEELWLADVMSVVDEVQILTQKASRLCEHLFEKFSSNPQSGNVLKSIENYDRRILHSNSETSTPPVKNHRSNCWLVCNFDEDIRLYINCEKRTYKWVKPNEIRGAKISSVAFGGLKEIKDDVEINKNVIDVQLLIHLQAAIRGFLVRRKTAKKLKAILIIQKWWRRVRHRLRRNCLETEERTLRPDLGCYRDFIDKVIKIQALWRGYWCRKNLKLKRSISPPRNPTFQYLKSLASSRHLDSHDYSAELKVQAMKSSVVETIKRNQELSRRLEEMDTKIGLLVQNRMSVEAIVAENKKLQNVNVHACESKGIKAFSKEAKRLLDGYQQLFYILQTDPAYLTRLIVRLPSRPNHVIQSCVMSLFNYGSSSRDAYLLLRLFRTALFEEVRYTFQKPVDAVRGNPLVLKLAVSFARQVEGHNPLRTILGFLIEKVLNDKVILDTNPVDIYRRWVNQMEMESGRRSELTPVVTVEEALSHPEVVSRLNHNIRILKSWVKCFLDRLTECVNQFPYALRFTAKLLKNALLQKFPQTPEKDILKIVGNVVYYQYINSAIVAPDGFYIISLPADQHLRAEQRRNLASIAKILHFAATKKGFGEESKHLMSLNPFIIECHEEMKKFCRNCCAVEDLEEHFRITKYSEAALIDKPRIYITLEEIRECHKLLSEVRHEVAPDSLDPIHEILDELGPPPSLAILIGCSEATDGTLSRAGKIQVCLELDNKFQIPPEDPTEAEKLFIKTKELISKRLGELNGETLSEAIRDPKHADIATNLAKLELAGVVKSSDDYESILKCLIQDVSDKQEYRRALNQEISILRTAQQRLNEKRKFCEDQLSYYEQYLRTCLNNLKSCSNKSKHKKGHSVKYSGTRLRDKGVLIALNGVPPNQLRNVQFEISTTPFSGIYSVQGRFMGIEVEKIDIDIQELLRLQFEGHREMDLFGKAQINVNLLLHLLNKKFLGRT